MVHQMGMDQVPRETTKLRVRMAHHTTRGKVLPWYVQGRFSPLT